eukprot:TRINITY_DN13169_c0_g1_i5.p1 TRINITY_DN13169_c0_g1~~TRINITY_DN13169_c0_g1_i5.p1  ORF type:complete len:935 (-),score=203.74 TRINITY_DN13169_c0_g1_i5:80-2884(-)
MANELQVEIGLIRAINLPAGDSNGLSDPYVVVFLGEKDVARTSTVSETLNPVWNESCSVPYDAFKANRFICFEVWDNDTMSADDRLCTGRVWLPEESGTHHVSLLGHLAAKQPGPRPPILVVNIRLPDLTNSKRNLTAKLDADKADNMPGGHTLGMRISELLPSSQLWPRYGRCRVLPHDDEEVLQHLPHIRITSKAGEKSACTHGTLLLTQYRLVFVPVDYSGLFAVSLPAIQSITRHKQGSGRRAADHVTLVGKDAHYYCFTLIPMAGAWESERSIACDWILRDIHHRCLEHNFHVPSAPICSHSRHHAYDARKEFKRQGVDDNPLWRETSLNHDYELCPTYPHVLILPSFVSDENYEKAAQFRSKQRVPALSWHHPTSGGILCRCSQPMTGVSGKHSEEDDQLLLAIRYAAQEPNSVREAADNAAGYLNNSTLPALHIVDCRSGLAASGNKLMGKGTEDTARLQSGGVDRAKLHFLNIGNIHDMRGALTKLTEGHGELESGQQKSTEAFTASEAWTEHLIGCLNGAAKAALFMDKGHAVLVHCSDGWDRTSQVCALAQLMLDPFYRTMEGFAVLVEKDWLAFGHMLQKRAGSPSTDESSPIFLQFIDCVWQLSAQHPTEFEFNELYLLFLIDACYSQCYGNFLGNCERERIPILEESYSVWEQAKHHSIRFGNPLYDPTPSTLDHGVTTLPPMLTMNPFSIRNWPALYRQSYGRNFVSNEQMMMYHSTLEVLRGYLGAAVVDGAARVAQEQLWLNDMSAADSEVDWKEGLEMDASTMLAAQTELLSAIGKKHADLQARAQKKCIVNHMDSVEEFLQGADEQVNATVEDIVGETMWRIRCGDDNAGLERSHTCGDDGAGPEDGMMVAPYWVPDEQVNECTVCTQDFTFTRRKHHCRGCGNIFCDQCSSKEGHVPWRRDGPHRLCNKCKEYFG